ncbi:MAG: hypothetical protein N2508_11495 [Anaerolineae bacterium]|nr:hypothetical protein [Anaerolineae bacterium]
MKPYTKFLIVFTALTLLTGSLLMACKGETEQTTTAPATEQQQATPQGQPASLDGEALVAERCSTCHSLSPIRQTSRTGEEWREIVTRMVRKGAKLNAEEQEAVVKYLTETYGK